MASKQIQLKYRTIWHDLGVIATCLSFPIWGFSLVVPIFLLPLVLAQPALGIFLIGLSLSLVLVGVYSTIVFLDYALSLNEDGLSFPYIMLPALQMRRQRSWADLARVRVLNPDPDRGTVEFIFRTGGSAKIHLKNLKQKEKEELLLAIEVWGRSAARDPELGLMHNNLIGSSTTSYTHMWEEEMSRRFSSTAFVPLSDGHALQSGRLRIVKQHACGGLSAIYLAQLNRTEMVILKEFMVPDVDGELRAKAEELFNREAELLARLSHPQIAKVRDHFVEDERTYMVLDYIQGTDLRQVVKRSGPQKPQQVLDWARQLTQILTFLHSQSPPIIHRDLTPDNIVLKDDGQLVLIDFGAANEFVGTATGTLVGKQAYIAPEQFRGDTEPASDIYSLGATLFYLLTGCDPEPLSESSLRAQNPEINEELETLVKRCTAFELAERFATAQELENNILSLASIKA